MKISNNWLKDFIKTDLSTDKISTYLTDIGLEVEGIDTYESVEGSLEGIIVGRVLTCEKHPNADKLSKTTVDVGGEKILDIVCGAPNVKAGILVPVAVVGTKIYKKEGDSFEIEKAKIRGEVSEGMICAEDELGLGNNHDGIMILDESYEVGQPFSKYFNLTKDSVYEVGLTPNRADAMSHYGVARDLHAFLYSSRIVPSEFEKIENEPLEIEGNLDFEIEIENQNLCPRYLGAIIKNVKVQESPEWIKNRLKAIGLSPINNVVDVTNYILHAYGQPLHVFDLDKISGNKIKIGNPEKGIKFKTVDGVERELKGTEIVAKDFENRPLYLAGVLGGKETEITNETTNIFIESAYFDPVSIRKSAKLHGLNTDASFRFERGIDISLTKKALVKAIKMIQELAGGALAKELMEFYPEEKKPFHVVLRYSKLDQILGIKIHRETIKRILKSLEISVINEIADGLELLVPNYRVDVCREIDVIEEILRIYGYNKVDSPQKISFSPIKLDFENQDALENSWARLLQHQGFYEVMNNSLTSLKDETNAVKLLNPLSNDLAFMRKSLLEGLLQNAIYNINRKNPDIKFFEFGKIYHHFEKYQERKQLAILISGRNFHENWIVPKSVSNFYDLKAYVALLFEKMGLTYEEKSFKADYFSDAIEFVNGSYSLARLGKVSKNQLKEFDIEQETFYAEIDLEICQKLRNKTNFKFREIPKFNKIRRDLALLVDKNVLYSDLYQSVLKKNIPYLKNINLFDVYEGKNLPEGKKSYALSFELLNEEKTLEEKEITSVMERLIQHFENQFGASLRS